MKKLSIMGGTALVALAALANADLEGSKWISAADAKAPTDAEKKLEQAAPGTSCFKREVKNLRHVVKATWTASGLGVFNLSVNGKAVGNDFLKPGFTDAQKTKYSFSYDITDLIGCNAGDLNLFEAQVSTGWWNDKVIGYKGQKSAFRAVIELTYANRQVERIPTDVAWWAGVGGPVVRAGIFDGEIYDARKSVKDTAFKPAVINEEFKGEVLPMVGPSIVRREDLTLKPVEQYVWKGVKDASTNAFGTVIKLDRATNPTTLNPGETLVIDFGQNAAAVPEFTASAAAGTQILILPAEMLNDTNGLKSRGNDGPEGSVYRVNLREVYQTGTRVEYTFAGKGDETYAPAYTFFGYRYVSVTTTAPVTFKSFTSVPVTSIHKEMELGSVTTGNKDVNRLIKNVLWGQYSNYLSVPTDCPQRNERQGWMADTQVFTLAGTFNAYTYDFMRKFMRDVRDTQTACDSYTGVAPSGEYGDAGDKRLGWADCGIITPYVVWRQTGRTDLLVEHWDSMVKFMNFLKVNRYVRGSALEYQWADWLSYEDYESCSGRGWTVNDKGERHLKPETSLYWKYLGGCYWLWDARMMAEMADALGKTEEAKAYRAMADEALAYIRKDVLENGQIPACLKGMQTPALFAIRLGLLENPADVEATKAALLQNIKDHGNCLQTGFLGTSILMETLTDYVGAPEVAYTLLLQHDDPSWLYSVDQGATTIWERWNSYTKAKGFGPVGMNSFNHYAYGAVLAWIYETAAGIRAGETAGWDTFKLAPIPDERLGFIDASYKTPHGIIRSAWKYEDGVCKWTYTIPEGTKATVCVNGICKQQGPGTYTDEIKK